METKYTDDGKKVVVIGNLNSQEKIVQEVFITNGGGELPSGDNFVVKSLHDVPVISWKEKRLKDMDDTYAKRADEYDRTLRTLESNYYKQRDILSAKTDYLRSVVNHISLEAFDMVTNYLLGKFKYTVYDGYLPTLAEFKDFMCDSDHGKMALVSLCGDDKGTLDFRINQYRDGSGGSRTYFFFTDKDSAITKMKELIVNERYITDELLELAKEYDVALNPDFVAKFKADKLKSLLSYEVDYANKLKSTKAAILKIEQL